MFVVEPQQGDIGKHKVKILLRTPNEDEEPRTIGTGEFDINQLNEGQSASFIIGIGDLIFKEEGKYEFAIIIDDENLHNVPLRLLKV
ncbi:MAG: hypothetical protein GXZ09_00655 [Syntrophomonadaceae bacterium]|nr:hypothetical protein [Syntrophomonadaceae bacterium]